MKYKKWARLLSEVTNTTIMRRLLETTSLTHPVFIFKTFIWIFGPTYVEETISRQLLFLVMLGQSFNTIQSTYSLRCVIHLRRRYSL